MHEQGWFHSSLDRRQRRTREIHRSQERHSERLIGSIRRECLGHNVAFGEAHLRRILNAYTYYYNEARTHLALGKDVASRRPIQHLSQITARPILGALHQKYCRT